MHVFTGGHVRKKSATREGWLAVSVANTISDFLVQSPAGTKSRSIPAHRFTYPLKLQALGKLIFYRHIAHVTQQVKKLCFLRCKFDALSNTCEKAGLERFPWASNHNQSWPGKHFCEQEAIHWPVALARAKGLNCLYLESP